MGDLRTQSHSQKSNKITPSAPILNKTKITRDTIGNITIVSCHYEPRMWGTNTKKNNHNKGGEHVQGVISSTWS